MEKALDEAGKTTPAPETASQSSVTDSTKKPFVSTGQHIHKWGTYFGVDWFFNAAVGVAFAYWGKFTETGQKFWSGPIQNGFKTILSPFIKDEAKLWKSVGRGNIFMSIIAGGMFTIPPLMILEDKKNRVSISRWWDELIHGKEVVAGDPKFEASYKAIENEPKKEFWPGLTSRFVALSPLLAIVLIPKSNEVATKLWFRHVENASEWIGHKAGFSAAKNFKPGFELTNGEKLPVTPDTKWKFIHESMGMDFGLGMPYAVLHSIFYNMFAKDDSKKSQQSPTAVSSPTVSMTDQHIDELPNASHHAPTTKVQSVQEHHVLDTKPSLEIAAAH